MSDGIQIPEIPEVSEIKQQVDRAAFESETSSSPDGEDGGGSSRGRMTAEKWSRITGSDVSNPDQDDMGGGGSAGMKGGISQVMTTEEEDGGGGGRITPYWADVTGDVITDPDQEQKKGKMDKGKNL